MANERLSCFNPDVDTFFLCRYCRTHIAKTEAYSTHEQGWERAEPVFTNVTNVYTCNPTVQQEIRECPVADVHCKSCRLLLGKQFSGASMYGGRNVASDYILELKKLMKWDGQSIVEAFESPDHGISKQKAEYPTDFTIDEGFSQSAADRIGLDLNALLNDHEPNNSSGSDPTE